MDAREEVAELAASSAARFAVDGFKVSPSDEVLVAILRFLNVLDEDLQKLRKELRTRNGGSDEA